MSVICNRAAPMLAAVLLAMAAPAAAATITEVPGPVPGRVVPLDPADFTAAPGACGYGGSVVGDGCSVVLKDDPLAPHAFGRADPFGGSWIDSQDLERVVWRFDPGYAFTSVTFALFDAFDQFPSERLNLGESFFTLTVGDAEWSIAEREEDGTVHWLTVAFDAPVESAELLFATRLNDGWGVSLSAATTQPQPPAPVPLPATAPLAALGLGALALAGRRRGHG